MVEKLSLMSIELIKTSPYPNFIQKKVGCINFKTMFSVAVMFV